MQLQALQQRNQQLEKENIALTTKVTTFEYLQDFSPIPLLTNI
jgi:hypothetical protein